MAGPWGGSLSFSQLAEKFGWFSIIFSLPLLPLIFLYRWILAFPPYLACIAISARSRYIYRHPEHDVVRRKIYLSRTNQLGCCPAFIMHADPDGGKWFESYWGIINVLDMEAKNSIQKFKNHLACLQCQFLLASKKE